jgi:hypothetical protein
MEANYDEIRGWFRLPRRLAKPTGDRRDIAAFVAFIVVGGVLFAAITPDFGLNRTTLAVIAGMTGAVAVVTIGFRTPTEFWWHRHYREWGRIEVLPGSVIVAVVCVAFSRLADLQPGYLYGLLAGFAFRRRISESTEGRLVAANTVFVLAVCTTAWIARVPVSAAAARPGASAWLFALETCLAAIFLLGIESVAMSLLPMRFLDGIKLLAWSRVVWALLLSLGIFAVVQILLTPGSGYVGHTTGGVTIAVATLFLAFSLASVAFWGYFRYRPSRMAFEPEEFEDFAR